MRSEDVRNGSVVERERGGAAREARLSFAGGPSASPLPRAPAAQATARALEEQVGRTRVAVRQEGADAEEHFRDGESRAPLVLQDVCGARARYSATLSRSGMTTRRESGSGCRLKQLLSLHNAPRQIWPLLFTLQW